MKKLKRKIKKEKSKKIFFYETEKRKKQIEKEGIPGGEIYPPTIRF